MLETEKGLQHEQIILEILSITEDIQLTADERLHPTQSVLETIFFALGLVYSQFADAVIKIEDNEKIVGSRLVTVAIGMTTWYNNFDSDTHLWPIIDWIVTKLECESDSRNIPRETVKSKKKHGKVKSLANTLFDTTKDVVKEIVKPTKKYAVKGSYEGKPNVKEFEEIHSPEKKVILSLLAFKKIFAAVDKYAKENKEIGFYPYIEKRSETEYYVTDVEIPAQTIQSAYFEVPAGEIFKMKDANKITGLIHSHHSMGVFFSGNDEQTMKQGAAECGKGKFYLSIIVNSARNAVAKLFERSIGKIEKISVMYEVESDIEEWLNERDKEVTRYVYKAPANAVTRRYPTHMDDDASSYYYGNNYLETCDICYSQDNGMEHSLIPFEGALVCADCISKLKITPDRAFTDPEEFYKVYPDAKYIDEVHSPMPMMTISFIDANPHLAPLVGDMHQTYINYTRGCTCDVCVASEDPIEDDLYVSDWGFKNCLRKIPGMAKIANDIPITTYWKKCFNAVLDMVKDHYNKISFVDTITILAEDTDDETDLTPSEDLLSDLDATGLVEDIPLQEKEE